MSFTDAGSVLAGGNAIDIGESRFDHDTDGLADSQQQSRDRIVELPNEIEGLQVKLANTDATRNELRDTLGEPSAARLHGPRGR